LNHLGNLLQEHLKQYDESEQAYRGSIELDPQDANTWTNLGNLLQDHLNRYEESGEAYRRAIELEPRYADPWNDLGNLLQDHLKRRAEAEQAYKRAIELDPQSPYPWSNLGRLLDQSSGLNKEAGDAFLHAFELDPQRFWDLGRFLQIYNRLVESPSELPGLLTMAQKARELAPDNPEAQFLLARILAALERWLEASQLLEQLAANESAFFSNDFFRTPLRPAISTK
jgi:predicted Zn-dependent protease